jgi:hypothetical protein
MVMTTINYNAQYAYDQGAVGIEIPIALIVGDMDVRLNAKVDTGAQYCIFQRDYAEQLRIVVENGIRIEIWTAGRTSFIVYGHEVRMSCLDWEIDTTVYFAEAPGFNRNVVGRTGWLQQFRFGLIDSDSTLYLSHYND